MTSFTFLCKWRWAEARYGDVVDVVLANADRGRSRCGCCKLLEVQSKLNRATNQMRSRCLQEHVMMVIKRFYR